MFKRIDRKAIRTKKHLRIRKNIVGTTDSPRLAVYRSAKHIYAQIIDDTKGATLVAASTLDAALKGQYGGNKETAKKVGLLIAEKAAGKGIKSVVFDRGGLIYHGRIAALAEGAREGGLEF
ncbi:50S ribosomal protein L18 [Dehalobacterium formicoaceticum]|uniref:Large ribosomal subunit protein uL18 n=1 Tax=Dehalobacterium formicoaceticum TaxID=51515 RepID=A0ABT1Y1A3_9FIRM|nr:50S ribosomal protein L18 [Dehalobacterium formicoaceticum]MCR6543970.1 50S ribosomal protein L18 [Dehalobacterium formicoaceticum]